MRTSMHIALALTLFVTSGARGDETRPGRVRAQVNVEVIDDASHVEDIISRHKAQSRATALEAAPPEARKPAAPTATRPERPPLPEAIREGGAQGDKATERKLDRRLDHRADRTTADRHQRSRHRR